MSFPGKNLQRCWHLVDAKKQTVGRLANQVASILRGKVSETVEMSTWLTIHRQPSTNPPFNPIMIWETMSLSSTPNK